VTVFRIEARLPRPRRNGAQSSRPRQQVPPVIFAPKRNTLPKVATPRSFSCPYSPKCVEGVFSELRLYGVLRSLSPYRTLEGRSVRRLAARKMAYPTVAQTTPAIAAESSPRSPAATTQGPPTMSATPHHKGNTRAPMVTAPRPIVPNTAKVKPQRSGLELPSIGWQLFILGNSQSDSTAFLSFLDTYATRLLTEPLRGQGPKPLKDIA
jgi:hypothetical protein